MTNILQRMAELEAARKTLDRSEDGLRKIMAQSPNQRSYTAEEVRVIDRNLDSAMARIRAMSK